MNLIKAIIGTIFMTTLGIGYCIFLVVELFIEHKKEKDESRTN